MQTRSFNIDKFLVYFNMGKWNDFLEHLRFSFGIEKSKDVEITENKEKLTSYYSIECIFYFSTTLTTIFGSILMAINLNEKKDKKNIIWVLIFGFAFGLLQIYIVSISDSIVGFWALALTGYFILKFIFWENHINPETGYTRKSILMPLIIGIPLFIIKIFFIDL